MRKLSASYVAAALALIALIAVRAALIPLTTADQFTFLLPWLADAQALGAGYLRSPFTNYTPFYEHLLAGLALLPGPPLVRIKLLSIFFDFALAGAVAYLTLPGHRVAAFLLLLAMPSIILNSSLLGQSGSMYAAPVMLALGFAAAGSPVASAVAMSVALAIKLQAAIYLPVMLLLALQRRQPLWTFALLPVAYLLFAIPMLIAGRPITQTFLVYLGQFEALHSLSLNAPNPWSVLQKFVDYGTGLAVGIPFAILAVGAAVLLVWRSGIGASREGLLLSAAILLILGPYVMPKMHDRFFFLVDPVLVALACSYRGYVLPLIAAELGSLAAYVPYIARTYGRGNWLFGEEGYLKHHLSIGWGAFVALGLVSMGLALFLLIRRAYERRDALAGREMSGPPSASRLQRSAPATSFCNFE